MRLPLLLLAAVSLLQQGCMVANRLFPPTPFSKRAPCALQPGASKVQIVQYLNRNITGTDTRSGLASWRSSHVRLSVPGWPSLPASIAIEAPRNLRLRVSDPLSRNDIVDLGSNARQFWVWAKDGQPKNVITAAHEDLPAAQDVLRIPFQPDWLMEVLGVIPINVGEVTLRHPDPSSPTVELVSTVPSPTGPIEKVIRVDSCHGIVREHALYDARGVIIARAALYDHGIDTATGLVMPHLVRIDWPEMNQQLTMRIDKVELNPPPLQASAWTVPTKPGYPTIDLKELVAAMRRQQLQVPGAGVNPFQQVGGSAWADPQPLGQSTGVNGATTGAGRPSAYSAEAVRSSSAPRPRGRALWRWPSR